MNAQEVIAKLGLVPLPEEGGFYRETYRDPYGMELARGKRSFSTCIYYLITPEEFSKLHAVKSTEIFHFYAGDPVEMLQIDEDYKTKVITMGSDLSKDQCPQVVVPPLIWQGTRLKPGGAWALMGCSVAPGFEFSDFLMPGNTDILSKISTHQELAKQLL